ncbi:hypothetical protein D3C75_1174970 [compost metagenome]
MLTAAFLKENRRQRSFIHSDPVVGHFNDNIALLGNRSNPDGPLFIVLLHNPVQNGILDQRLKHNLGQLSVI